MNGFGLSVAVFLVLQMGLSFSLVSGAEDQSNKFDGWPDQWVDAYHRFDAYLEARRKDWPDSQLRIDASGKVTHNSSLGETRQRNLLLRLYRNGMQCVEGNDATAVPAKMIEPGSYSACLVFSRERVFQTLDPIIGFRVEDPHLDKGGELDPNDFVFAPIIPDGHSTDQYWPNARLQAFIDFLIFPYHQALEIRTTNNKVDPNIQLKLSPEGVLEWDPLPSNTKETLLRWRIYKDETLVNDGAVGDTHRYLIHYGPGTYHVCIGVDGPSGFLPVSNILEFPLFPAVDGKLTVNPEDLNHDRIPDYLQRIRNLEVKIAENFPASDLRSWVPCDVYWKGEVSERDERLRTLWQDWVFKYEFDPPIKAPGAVDLAH